MRGLDVRGVGRRHAPVHHERHRPARRLVRVAAGEGRPHHQRHHRHLGGPRRAGHRLRAPAPFHRQRGRRPPRKLGLPRGRHGRGVRRARALRRGARGARSAPARRSRRSSCRTAGRWAWRSKSGEELRPRSWSRRVHPQIAFLRHLDRKDLPAGLRHRHRALEDAQRRREDQPRPLRAARASRPTPARSRRTTTAAASSCACRRSTRRTPSRTPRRGGRRAGPSWTAPSRATGTRRWPPRASTSSRCSPSGCPRSGTRSRTARSSRPTPIA